MTRGLPYVFLNRSVVSVRRAHVSVLDRGLLYGDGLFETLRIYRGGPFALRAHLTRLRASARFLGIPVPPRPWERDIRALLRRNRLTGDASVRITLTRGAAPPGLLPLSRPRPTLLIMAGRIDPAIALAQRRGARVVLLPFGRHGFLAEHKVLDYLPGVLGKVIAARHAAFEGLYVDAGGCITEGTTSNVFLYHRGRLLTPPPSGILPGVTRGLIIKLAAAAAIRVTERPITRADLHKAEEVFLTSSLAEVVPVVCLDDRPIGGGAIGEQTERLGAAYRQLVDKIGRRKTEG